MCRAVAETFSGGGPYSLFSKALEKASKSPIERSVVVFVMPVVATPEDCATPICLLDVTGEKAKVSLVFNVISAKRIAKKFIINYNYLFLRYFVLCSIMYLCLNQAALDRRERFALTGCGVL